MNLFEFSWQDDTQMLPGYKAHFYLVIVFCQLMSLAVVQIAKSYTKLCYWPWIYCTKSWANQGIKSGVCHTHTQKKKLPKCVSGHLKSLRTHLFLGEKKGGTPILRHFVPKFHEFWRFFKVFYHLRWEKEKMSEVLKNGFWKVYFCFFCVFFLSSNLGGGNQRQVWHLSPFLTF